MSNSLKSKQQSLLKTIKPLTSEMYHYSDVSLEKYWGGLLEDIFDEDISDKMLNGTLTADDIDNIEEQLIFCAEYDIEQGAPWNYVSIDKKINLNEEIEHTKNILLDESNSWVKGDKLEDIIRTYCYYKIGQYEVYSFQIDATNAYKHLTKFTVADNHTTS